MESLQDVLRKLAAELREAAELRKTAAVELDPEKVRDFLLFFGRGSKDVYN